MDQSIDSFKVYIRIRPLLQNEKKLIETQNKKGKTLPPQIVSSQNNTVFLFLIHTYNIPPRPSSYF